MMDDASAIVALALLCPLVMCGVMLWMMRAMRERDRGTDADDRARRG